MELSYHLIPDGMSTIVQIEVKGEFYVSTANASQEAEAGVVKLLARLTGQPEEAIKAEIDAGRWTGEGWRPEEPKWGPARA